MSSIRGIQFPSEQQIISCISRPVKDHLGLTMGPELTEKLINTIAKLFADRTVYLAEINVTLGEILILPQFRISPFIDVTSSLQLLNRYLNQCGIQIT